MAKREFIETREIVYVNAPISPILQGDSVHYEDIAFKAQIGRIHTFSEQDIVKPYLERLKRRMEARDDDNGGEPLNAVDRGYHWAYEHLCEEIDNLLSENDWNAPYKGGQEDGKA